jgi:peroxiredoxin
LVIFCFLRKYKSKNCAKLAVNTNLKQKMAATPSNMIELGTRAPEFNLPDTNDHMVVKSLLNLKGKKGTMIVFICNHCPFVKHLNSGLVNWANEFAELGIQTIAISSNDVEKYPQDHPDCMAEHAAVEAYSFPYLYDESQEIAKAFQAACTPDFYLFDADLKLVYRGQFDESRPSNGIPVTGESLRRAAKALLNGDSPIKDQFPSIGCNIKWKES